MRFFRLCISELTSTLELVVEVPDDLLINDKTVNRLAATTVADRWRQLHENQPDPPRFPSKFEIEPIDGFDPGSVQPEYGPYKYTNGARVWITKPIPSLVFRGY